MLKELNKENLNQFFFFLVKKRYKEKNSNNTRADLLN